MAAELNKKKFPFKLTSAQIEEITGLNINTQYYYKEAGALVPDIDAGGRGNPRLWSGTNMIEASIIKRSMDYGLPKKIIVEMMNSIREAGDRNRLDPGRWLEIKQAGSEDLITEYLLFFTNPDEKPGISHRFVLDAGDKHQGTLEDLLDRSADGVTSLDKYESIRSILTLYAAQPLFLINISMFHYLVWEAFLPAIEKHLKE
jgi:hypothetical protein